MVDKNSFGLINETYWIDIDRKVDKEASRKVLDAIKQNGYRKAVGSFITLKAAAKGKYTPAELDQIRKGTMLPKDKEDVYSACALGQASLNLGIPANKLPLHPNVSNTIMSLNDDRGLSLKQIVKEMEEYEFSVYDRETDSWIVEKAV